MKNIETIFRKNTEVCGTKMWRMSQDENAVLTNNKKEARWATSLLFSFSVLP